MSCLRCKVSGGAILFPSIFISIAAHFFSYFKQQLLVLCLSLLSRLLQREPSPHFTKVPDDVCAMRHTAKSAQPLGVVSAAAIMLSSGVTHLCVPKEHDLFIFG